MNATAIRQVDVLALTNVTDCEILLAECKHAITQIDEDLKNCFSDEEWEYRARRARVEIEHKAKMVTLKRDSLKQLAQS